MNVTTRRLGAALAAGAATLSFAPAALAAPVPCDKFLVSDAVGDQAYKQQGQAVFAAPSNADVVGYFFRVDGGKVTANIAVEDLTKTLPQGFSAIRYRIYATLGGTERYYEAKLTASGVTYTYGSELELVYTEDGEAKGNFFEGKKGVVQIEIPADAGGKVGTKLELTSASIGLLTNASAPPETQLPPVYFGVDTAPDGSADGPNTTPSECATVVGDPTPAGDPQTPAPSSPPPSSQPAPSPGSPSKSQSKPLTLSLAKASLSAKKSRKSGTLVLKSSEALTAVKATLKRGAAAVGSVSVAKVSGSAPLKFKFKKPLKKGAHSLVVTGKRADGSAFSVTLKVTVTK